MCETKWEKWGLCGFYKYKYIYFKIYFEVVVFIYFRGKKSTFPEEIMVMVGYFIKLF